MLISVFKVEDKRGRPPRNMLPTIKMAPRLDEKSKAVQLLRKRFRAGEISKGDDAAAIKASDPLFKDYNTDTFRTRVNRLKREYFGSDGKSFFS